MLQSFLVYSLLTTFLCLAGIYASKKNYVHLNNKSFFFDKAIIFSFILFSVVSGLRYDVGVDYLTYLESYQKLKLSFTGLTDSYEIGFLWILKLFATFKVHYFWLFGLFAFIQIFFVYFAFKEERNLYPFIPFVIMTSGIYFTMMNEIRQSIVWAILIFAFRFANKKGIIYYLTLTAIGFLFHRTALLFIPFYFLINIDRDLFRSYWLQFLLLISSMVLSDIAVWDLMMKKIEFAISFIGYGEKYGDVISRMAIWEREYTKGIRYFAPAILFSLIILYSKRLKIFFKETRFVKYYNFYFIGSLCYFLFYNNTLLQRPVRYFIVMQLVITSYFLSYLWIYKFKNFKNLLALITIIVLHLSILIAFVLSDHHTMYLFFWQS